MIACSGILAVSEELPYVQSGTLSRAKRSRQSDARSSDLQHCHNCCFGVSYLMPGQPDPERTADQELPGKLLGQEETIRRRLRVMNSR